MKNGVNEVKYHTNANLLKIWQQLDNASSFLYMATDNIADLKGCSTRIAPLVEKLDISIIDTIKNEVEGLIDPTAFDNYLKRKSKK
jgi:hypothetical protein